MMRLGAIFSTLTLACGLTIADALAGQGDSAAADRFTALFPRDSLEDWRFSHWADVATPPKMDGTPWKIERGVLYGLDRRTWIFSQRDYGDFVLKFEIRISKGANSGIGIRFPPEGDPAYRGMEIQFVDGDIYYHSGNWRESRPEQLTGSIYDEIAAKPAMKPAGEWNIMQITCRDSQVAIMLNGQAVLDVDVCKETKARQKKGPPLADRPRKGRIGFQNLKGRVTLRNLMIKSLD